jgi:hypothetical protein
MSAHYRSLARKTKNGPQARRLLAAIYDGAPRAEAAKSRVGPIPAVHGVVRPAVDRSGANGYSRKFCITIAKGALVALGTIPILNHDLPKKKSGY